MTGVELIAKERQRQIDEEGWTAEKHDVHTRGELALAGACYAMWDPEGVEWTREDAHQYAIWLWPWDEEWWKPKDRIRNLVRAGALIAAEIDRLQRQQEDTPMHADNPMRAALAALQPIVCGIYCQPEWEGRPAIHTQMCQDATAAPRAAPARHASHRLHPLSHLEEPVNTNTYAVPEGADDVEIRVERFNVEVRVWATDYEGRRNCLAEQIGSDPSELPALYAAAVEQAATPLTAKEIA